VYVICKGPVHIKARSRNDAQGCFAINSEETSSCVCNVFVTCCLQNVRSVRQISFSSLPFQRESQH